MLFTTKAVSAVVAIALAPGSCIAQHYVGKMTHYDVGLGACGIINVASDVVVALSHELMGDWANGAPPAECFGTMTVVGPRGQAVATIVDKCPGCEASHIDASLSLFDICCGADQRGDVGAGSCTVEWTINN